MGPLQSEVAQRVLLQDVLGLHVRLRAGSHRRPRPRANCTVKHGGGRHFNSNVMRVRLWLRFACPLCLLCVGASGACTVLTLLNFLLSC